MLNLTIKKLLYLVVVTRVGCCFVLFLNRFPFEVFDAVGKKLSFAVWLLE